MVNRLKSIGTKLINAYELKDKKLITSLRDYNNTEVVVDILNNYYYLYQLGSDVVQVKYEKEKDLIEYLNTEIVDNTDQELKYDITKENNIVIYGKFKKDITEEQLSKINILEDNYDNVYLVIDDNISDDIKKERFKNIRRVTYKRSEHIITKSLSYTKNKFKPVKVIKIESV